MLARKYYAQKGTSKGSMNTNAVTQSGSSRIHRLRNWSTPIVKTTPNRSASEKIQKDALDTIRCGSTHIRSGNTSSTCANAICNIVKEQTGKATSSEQTKQVVSKQTCNKDTYWGKMVPNHSC